MQKKKTSSLRLLLAERLFFFTMRPPTTPFSVTSPLSLCLKRLLSLVLFPAHLALVLTPILAPDIEKKNLLLLFPAVQSCSDSRVNTITPQVSQLAKLTCS